MKLNAEDWSALTDLRHTIHQNPELSGEEHQTPDRILDFLQKTPPDQLIKPLGRTGMALVYDSGQPGPTVAFRTDLDALPIAEKGQPSYASQVDGVAHLCGHDGHMTMVTALGLLYGRERPKKGKVVLLYQPAEETGEGAAWVVDDPKFKELKPDFIFGLHNLPGEPHQQVILKEAHMNAASKGMVVMLEGKTSHAAEPHNGNSPAAAMSKLVLGLQELVKDTSRFEDFTLLTVIHAVLGRIAFGTTPGHAEVRATLRAYRDKDLDQLSQEAEALAYQLGKEYGLEIDISYREEFPAVKNSPEAFGELEKAAKAAGLEVTYKQEPYSWSEDFGHYKKVAHAGFFGLGSGTDQPELHHENFDFPDKILPGGVKMYYHLAQNILS